MSVRIYKLARDVDWWTWLCDRCHGLWLSRGWQIREAKDPPHGLTCDECGCGEFGVPIKEAA